MKGKLETTLKVDQHTDEIVGRVFIQGEAAFALEAVLCIIDQLAAQYKVTSDQVIQDLYLMARGRVKPLEADCRFYIGRRDGENGSKRLGDIRTKEACLAARGDEHWNIIVEKLAGKSARVAYKWNGEAWEDAQPARTLV